MSNSIVLKASDHELITQIPSDTLTDQICNVMSDVGAVGINNVFTSEFLKTAHTAYLQRYVELQTQAQDREVGDKRTMLAVDIKTPFDHTNLLANPLLMPALKKMLGDDLIMDSFVAVSSRPGSSDQHVHVDYPYLFEDEALTQSLPTYIITLAVPLVTLTPLSGTTRIWPATHRNAVDWKAKPSITDAVTIFPDFGGAYMFDGRLLHGGTANMSDESRPILYLVYCRSWWRDTTNFFNQKSLKISSHGIEELPENIRPLFRCL